MNTDFSRIVTLLRKERGLSQKQAAMELGVSQALLSHYEKGIRECGLDFVVRIADYYDVSCDYLLGRSADRKGATLSFEDVLPPVTTEDAADKGKGNALIALNKTLVQNSLNVIFDVLEETGSKGLSTVVSSYMMVSIYKMLRAVFIANPKNPQAMFSVTPDLYTGLSSALQDVLETNARCLASGRSTGSYEGVNGAMAPQLSPDVISRKYPEFAPALYNLIRETEEKIKKLS